MATITWKLEDKNLGQILMANFSALKKPTNPDTHVSTIVNWCNFSRRWEILDTSFIISADLVIEQNRVLVCTQWSGFNYEFKQVGADIHCSYIGAYNGFMQQNLMLNWLYPTDLAGVMVESSLSDKPLPIAAYAALRLKNKQLEPTRPLYVGVIDDIDREYIAMFPKIDDLGKMFDHVAIMNRHASTGRAILNYCRPQYRDARPWRYENAAYIVHVSDSYTHAHLNANGRKPTTSLYRSVVLICPDNVEQSDAVDFVKRFVVADTYEPVEGRVDSDEADDMEAKSQRAFFFLCRKAQVKPKAQRPADAKHENSGGRWYFYE